MEKYKKHNQEVLTLEAKEKLLTEYSKFLEKEGFLDTDWWCEGNTVEDFLGIK